MDKQKILITGTCGFIFSNFVRKLIYLSNKDPEKYPYTVVSIDKVNTNMANSIYWNKSHTFHIADITDPHIIDTIFQFEKPDIVIHGAAESAVDDSLSNPNVFITSNVLGTQVIINACLKYDVQKMIYISTDEVYGQLENESDPSWTESSPLNPRNPYAASKAAGELLVKAAHESHGLIYNITRTSNNYGPRQTPNKLIPKVIKCIINNEKIPVFGEGKQIRDWTHVFDNCSAIINILKNGNSNEIYNISANQEFSNIEVIQNICNVIGSGYNLIEHIEDPRKSHDFRYSIDSSKTKSLGWKPQYRFKDGIVDTIKWFYDNKWYLR